MEQVYVVSFTNFDDGELDVDVFKDESHALRFIQDSLAVHVQEGMSVEKQWDGKWVVYEDKTQEEAIFLVELKVKPLL